MTGALQEMAGRGSRSAADEPLDVPLPDTSSFTAQLHLLRGRLQGVVQAVREVAQSLDEPHQIINNVRDQVGKCAGVRTA